MKTEYKFSVLCVALLALPLVTTTMYPAVAMQTFAIVTCAATTACTGGTNTSSGPGVQGISSLGKGVVGQTKFNSTSSSNGQAGVIGQDLSTTGLFDTGVSGVSVRGAGVSGKSTSNSGVLGTSGSGTGVRGTASSGIGMRAASTSNTAVLGSTGTGAFALEGSAPSTVGVLGIGHTGVEGADNNSGGDVIFANGNGSNLIRANNSGGVDVFTVLNDGQTQMASAEVGTDPSSYPDGVQAFGNDVGVEGIPTSSGFGVGVRGFSTFASNSIAIHAVSHGGRILVGDSNDLGTQDAFVVDSFGNGFFAGNVSATGFTTHAALRTEQRTKSGAAMMTYATQASSPNIEDFGEATLVSGQTHVKLDAHFASAMARDTAYLVFITPQSAVHSPLYVTQKTPGGFDVREAYAERTAVVFDYRIVAKPYAAPTGTAAIIPQSLRRVPIREPRALPLVRHPRSEKLRISH